MADNLNQTLQELEETLKGGVVGWTNTIEELTRVTLRTGKEYGEGFKGLTDQFRGLDVALSDVKDMLGQSIRTGVSFEGTNKKLLVDLKRLGFNMGKFMDVMGTFEQVLGFSESTTAHLADSIVDFSHKFGRSAEQLASTMQNLIEPMARMSNAYGSQAAAGFAESIIGLGAAMGPKMADQLGPVLSKFISADPEGFKRAALAGQGGGAMDSPQAMINMAKGMMSRIDRLVTPGAPFSAGIAAQMFGLSQGDVNVLRQLAQTNLSQLSVAEENMRYENAKALAAQTFTGSLNQITFDLQRAFLPAMDAINDTISLVFNVFGKVFPDFAESAIEFGEFVAKSLRGFVTEDRTTGYMTWIKEVGESGIEFFRDSKDILQKWAEKTEVFFIETWMSIWRGYEEADVFVKKNWGEWNVKMNSWYDISLDAFKEMKEFFAVTAVGAMHSISQIGHIFTGGEMSDPDMDILNPMWGRDKMEVWGERLALSQQPDIKMSSLSPGDFGGMDPNNNLNMGARQGEDVAALARAMEILNESLQDGVVTQLELSDAQRENTKVLQTRKTTKMNSDREYWNETHSLWRVLSQPID